MTALWEQTTTAGRFGNVVQLPNNTRAVVPPAHQNWSHMIVTRLEHLTALPRGWDGYNAGPVRFGTASFALNLLQRVCPADGEAPAIVPGARGDLQIEWHSDDTDIELHVLAPYRVRAWRCGPMTPEDGEEFELTSDFTRVREWVQSFAESAVAANAAAA
ncbi:hypothetical protein [Bosea sp. Root670]|uniref:hypothetical protein n=1 Tax=Bosea sp. Root670 TaxID=1736583 RepID=UPI0012E3533D|nr:hypothetical protein [Bosea sp. Root670]